MDMGRRGSLSLGEETQRHPSKGRVGVDPVETPRDCPVTHRPTGRSTVPRPQRAVRVIVCSPSWEQGDVRVCRERRRYDAAATMPLAPASHGGFLQSVPDRSGSVVANPPLVSQSETCPPAGGTHSPATPKLDQNQLCDTPRTGGQTTLAVDQGSDRRAER